jgi:hypothetical protein
MLAIMLVAALTGASCANPSIISAHVKSVTTNGALNHYTVAITVRNIGDARQPVDLLQSVDVFQAGQRVGRPGLQPLRPEQSQTVTYSFDRSTDAGVGTTDLTFTLDFNGRSGRDVDCHAGNENLSISV